MHVPYHRNQHIPECRFQNLFVPVEVEVEVLADLAEL